MVGVTPDARAVTPTTGVGRRTSRLCTDNCDYPDNGDFRLSPSLFDRTDSSSTGLGATGLGLLGLGGSDDVVMGLVLDYLDPDDLGDLHAHELRDRARAHAPSPSCAFRWLLVRTCEMVTGVEVEQVDPGDVGWGHDRPAYRVHFWDRRASAGGGGTEWRSDEWRVADAREVDEVLAWAATHAAGRRVELLVEVTASAGLGVVRLAGIDPTGVQVRRATVVESDEVSRRNDLGLA